MESLSSKEGNTRTQSGRPAGRGRRAHFCLHSSVQRHSGARQNAMCRRVVDEHRCPFYTGFRKCGSKVSTALRDIEEIVESCREATVCPYFKVREDAKEADLLMLPYDYLISTQTRESLQVSLKHSILIFDEGHNIERSCEENASFEVTQADIAGAIGELEDAFDLVEQGEVNDEVLKDTKCDVFLKHLNLVKKHLFALEDAISAETLEQDAATGRNLRKAAGSHVLSLLAQPGARGIATEKEDLKHITQLIRRAADVLTRGQETLTSVRSLTALAFSQKPVGTRNSFEDAAERSSLFSPHVPADEVEAISPLARSSFDTWIAKEDRKKSIHPAPPDRFTHECHVKALDKFLTRVDGSPHRFEEIVDIYRGKSGFKDDIQDAKAAGKIRL
eukprot:s753_g25.t1